MMQYPLLFGFRDLVPGNGFVALVATEGRSLLVKEDGSYVMYGVNPGGLSEGGDTPAEADTAFRSSYRAILLDIAADATDFADFRAEVRRFFKESNAASEKAWLEAVDEVRAGRVGAEWLPRKNAGARRFVRVTEVEHQHSSAEDVVDSVEHVAA